MALLSLGLRERVFGIQALNFPFGLHEPNAERPQTAEAGDEDDQTEGVNVDVVEPAGVRGVDGPTRQQHDAHGDERQQREHGPVGSRKATVVPRARNGLSLRAHVGTEQGEEGCRKAERHVTHKHRGADACLLYTSPSPRDRTRSRMPSSA